MLAFGVSVYLLIVVAAFCLVGVAHKMASK